MIRRTIQIAALLVLIAQSLCAVSLDTSKYSPRNRERLLRRQTNFIILHTTEAPTESAVNKLSANGECHYMIDPNGRIYRIIDSRRVAYHVGVSMWNGRVNLDDCSIGIEMVGYHDKNLSSAQYTSLAALLRELKLQYKIPDERVMPHSMVAYGRPNQWQKRNHRGRKRCGMLFAQASVRKRLGLKSRQGNDPDVRSGRLMVADAYLQSVLFGGVRAVGDTPSTAASLNIRRTPSQSAPVPSKQARSSWKQSSKNRVKK